jgi:hypothetical protein
MNEDMKLLTWYILYFPAYMRNVDWNADRASLRGLCMHLA